MNNFFNYFRRSLSLKLSLVIVLLTVSVFMAALSILYTQSRSKIKEEVVRCTSSALNTTTMRVIRYLHGIEDATNVNAWLIEENFTPETALKYSRQIVLNNGNVDGCSVTAAPDVFPQYGRYFSAYSIKRDGSVVTAREAEYEYFEKPWYKNAVEAGGACWIDPYDDYIEGTLSANDAIASYSKPLYDAKGNLLGVVSTDVSLSRLTKVITATVPFKDAFYVMLNKEGHFLVSPDSTMVLGESLFEMADPSICPDVVALGHEMVTGKKGSLEIKIHGVPYLVSYNPLPSANWSLALVCPRNEMFHSYNRLTYLILPLLILGLLIILLLSYLAVDLAVRPLNRLVARTKSIAEGDFDEFIPESDRTDVVGNLQNSFRKMQLSLKKHVSDVGRLNAETEQRNKELLIARQQAEEGVKKKDIFIQNMTHQIRTPLNIILGFAQVVRDGFKAQSSDDMRSILDTMHHNSMLLSRMVLMLYDSSETGYSEELHSLKDEVGCNQIVQECIAALNGRFPDVPVGYETEVPDSLKMQINKVYLMRTLLEMAHNAVKFSDGKNIKICVRRADKTAVHFIVEDTGPGIPEENRIQMFEPFTKLNDLSEGLGLGLPLCKRHAVTMGGDLILDTSYHDGCRLVLELPCMEG